MHPRFSVCAVALALGCALAAQAALAQRDPLQPPPEARPPLPAATGSATNSTDSASALSAPRHLMSVDGRRYVVIGTRRHGVGELLGSARIERIDDSAVWVREGGTLQRLPVHGAARRLPAPEDSASAAARPAAAARPTHRSGRDPARAAPISRPAHRGAP